VIVADTNLVAYLLIEGEKTELARQVWTRDPQWRVPPLWRSEFLSVLATSVRVGVIEYAQAVDAWTNAKTLLGRCEREPGGENTLQEAVDHQISAYDAQFVVLAKDLEVKLVTADKKLRHACPEIAVSIEDFV
jgi:predicted nucleic acid-binding protein